MSKKQTAVQWLTDKLVEILGDKCNELTKEQTLANHYAIKQDLQMEREQMIDLVQSLKDYTNESHNILGHDEREASEFVDIYYTQTYLS